MVQEHVDVLINGCGIGGSALAYLLSRQGFRVAVVEQADRGRMLSGADLLKPAGIRVVDAMGLLGDVLRVGGRRRDTLRVFHDREQLCVVDYKANSELGYFILIPCERLRALILGKMDRLGEAVEMNFNTRIAEVLKDEHGNAALAKLNDGREISFTVLVGADGAASYTRKLLGITTERYAYPAAMYFGTLPLTPSVDECNRLYVDSSQGLAYFYPIGPEEARLVISFPKEEMRELMQDGSGNLLQARLRAFVSEVTDDAIAQVRDTRIFKGIPIGRLNLDDYYANNVVMLGDAIHNVHPITGQGMNLAIEDAGELAARLAEVLSNTMTLTDALAAYQARRHPINEGVVTYGHTLATSFHDKASFAKSFNVALQASSRTADLFHPSQMVVG